MISLKNYKKRKGKENNNDNKKWNFEYMHFFSRLELNLFILHIRLVFAHVFVLQERKKNSKQHILTAPI